MKYTSQPDGKTSFFQYDLQGRLKKKASEGGRKGRHSIDGI